MILTAVFTVLVGVLNLIFWLVSIGGHSVDLTNIPYIGDSVYSAVVVAVGYWNTALSVVPYLELPWNIFINFIIWFELALIILKVFLGSRTPADV